MSHSTVTLSWTTFAIQFSKDGRAAVSARILSHLIGAVVLLGIGLAGLSIWSEARWFIDWTYNPNEWVGYDKYQFTGLMFFLFSTPVGFALLFTVLQTWVRLSATSSNPRSHYLAIGVFVFVLLCLFAAGVVGSWYPLSTCGFFFCINTDTTTYKPFDPPFGEAGYGWRFTVGFSSMVMAFVFIVALGYQLFKHTQTLQFHHDEGAVTAPVEVDSPEDRLYRSTTSEAKMDYSQFTRPSVSEKRNKNKNKNKQNVNPGKVGSGKQINTSSALLSESAMFDHTPSTSPASSSSSSSSSAAAAAGGASLDEDEFDTRPVRPATSTRRHAYNTQMHIFSMDKVLSLNGVGAAAYTGAGAAARRNTIGAGAGAGGYHPPAFNSSTDYIGATGAQDALRNNNRNGGRSNGNGEEGPAAEFYNSYSQNHMNPEVVVGVETHLNGTAWLWYFAYLVGLTFCWFLTTFIPNNWEYFLPKAFAQKAGLKITHDLDTCKEGTAWMYYSCPEIPGAWFRSFHIKVTDHFYLHVFASNLIFYIFLAIVPLFALIIRQFKVLDRFCSRKIAVADYSVLAVLSYWFTCMCKNKCRKPAKPLERRQAFFSGKEIFIGLLTAGMVIAFFIYWFHDHNYNTFWPKKTSINLSEQLGRTMGLIAVVFFSLLMFPAARNSPLYSFLGISWEASIVYHRWLGGLFLLSCFLHMVFNWWWYWDIGTFPQDIIAVPMHGAISIDNFTTPLITLVTWFTFIAIGVFAMYEPFRRKSFELFWYMHQISIFVLVPATIWHATNGWEYMLPGLLIFLVDRAMRVYRSSRAVHLLDARTTVYSADVSRNGPAKNARVVTGAAVEYGSAGEIVHLRVDGSGMGYLPGQYAFLNVAELSLLEWHPFTISSPVHPKAPNEITFHIKHMGPNTWTERLYKTVKENNAITVSLDGPYGHPIDFRKYSTVLLVAGGIGLTPVKSIFESMKLSYLHDGALPSKGRSCGGNGGHEFEEGVDEDDADSDSGDDRGDIEEEKGANSASSPSSAASGRDPYKKPKSRDLGSRQNPLAGVTGPLASAFPKRVHMLMIGRDPSLFNVMRDSLSDLPYGPFSARLHVDVPPIDPSASASTHVPQSEMKFSPGSSAAAAGANAGPDDNGGLLDPAYVEAPSPRDSNSYSASSSSSSSSTSSSASNSNTSTAATKGLSQLLVYNRPNFKEALVPVALRRDTFADPLYPTLPLANLSVVESFSIPSPSGPVEDPESLRLRVKPPPPHETLLFVCGPPGVAAACEALAHEQGWDFHTETFAL